MREQLPLQMLFCSGLRAGRCKKLHESVLSLARLAAGRAGPCFTRQDQVSTVQGVMSGSLFLLSCGDGCSWVDPAGLGQLQCRGLSAYGALRMPGIRGIEHFLPDFEKALGSGGGLAHRRHCQRHRRKPTLAASATP